MLIVETLGMLVEETDGPGKHVSRKIILPLCTREEALGFAELLRQREFVSATIDKNRQNIRNRHVPVIKLEKPPSDNPEEALDEMRDLAMASDVAAAVPAAVPDYKRSRHRFAWYPWIGGVSLISWENEDSDEWDEEGF